MKKLINKNIFLILLAVVIIFTLSYSTQAQTIYEDCEIYGNCKPITTKQDTINYSSVNVNNSQYLQGLTPQQVANLAPTYNATYDAKAGTGSCPAGQVVQNTTTGGVQCVTVSSSVSVGGINGSVQFNDNNNLNGTGVFTYNKTTGDLFVDSLYFNSTGNSTSAGVGEIKNYESYLSQGITLDGTSGQVVNLGNSNINSTKAWTIDFWLYKEATDQETYLYDANFGNIEVSTGGLLVTNCGSAISITITALTWSHIELSYSGETGGTLYLFVNGVSQGTRTCTTPPNTMFTNWRIGGRGVGSFSFVRVDEVRLTNGTVRHTSGFTPQTTEYTTDANTRGLWHINGNGVDSSGNGLTAGIGGTYVDGKVTASDYVDVIKSGTYSGSAQTIIGNLYVSFIKFAKGIFISPTSNGATAVGYAYYTENNLSNAQAKSFAYYNGNLTTNREIFSIFSADGALGVLPLPFRLAYGSSNNYANFISSGGDILSYIDSKVDFTSKVLKITTSGDRSRIAGMAKIDAYIPSGNLSYGLAFNGSTGSRATGNFPTVSASQPQTYEMWVKPHSSTPSGRVYSDGGLAVELYFAGLIPTCNMGGSSISGSAVTANTWHHIACVGTGTTTYMFQDGVLKGSGTFATVGSTGNLAIGDRPGGGFLWNGSVDNIRVSNIARYTTAFNVPNGRFLSDSNTVQLLHCDEGTGTTCADLSGNGKTVTLGAGAAWTTGITPNTNGTIVNLISSDWENTGSNKTYVNISDSNIDENRIYGKNNIFDKTVQLTANTTAVTCNSSSAGKIYYDGGINKHGFCNSTDWNYYPT